MLKYEPIYVGVSVGAALKPEEEGIVKEVAIRAAGEIGGCEWVIYYSSTGEKRTFSVTNHFPDSASDKVRLGDLTKREFDETMDRLGFLPDGAKDELSQVRVIEVTHEIDNPELKMYY